MQEFQVTCITKPDRLSSHEHVTHIGNNANNWCMTRESAIQRIESKYEVYYTIDGASGKKSYIGIVRPSGRLPYLRCYADGVWNDNLLAQEECSAACELKG